MSNNKNDMNMYMNRRLQSKRDDFVNEFIELEIAKVWEEYLSKDESEKTRDDYVNRVLEETSEIWMLYKWKYTDDGYAMQLEKGSFGNASHIIRLYPNGKGVIVSIFDEKYKISYFSIPNNKQDKINQLIQTKINHILKTPHEYLTDDRYGAYPFVLWYGLLHIDENAYSKLKEYTVYEDKEYGYKENDFKIAKALFSIYKVKCLWEEHQKEEIN